MPTHSTQVSPRRRETRNRLVDAGLTVIAERGVLGASVEQICEEADFTRGAFYSNFDSKDELCAAIMREKCADIIAATRHTAADLPLSVDGTLPSIVDTAVERFMALQRSDPRWPIVSAELRLHAARSTEFRPTYLALRQEIHTEVGRIFAPALMQRGLSLPVPIEQALALMEAAQESATLQAQLLTDEPDPSEVAGDLKALLTALVRPA